MPDVLDPGLPAPDSTGRRALLAGIGGIAAGGLLLSSRAQAGPLAPPPGAPMPTAKPLGELEPRVAVNDTNTPTDGFAAHLISQPGSYYLTANIAFGPEKAGVLIDASNVTLDLNGFSIIGAGASSSAAGVAVASERADVLIHNGFIAECRSAVYGEESPGRVVVRNVHVRSTQFEAIFLSSQCVVEDCTVIDGGGISVGEGCRVSRCVVQGGIYFGIGAGARSIVESCQVSGTAQEGISVRSGVAENNVVRNCASGIRVPAGSNAVIRNNAVLDNTGVGLRVDSAGNTVSGNTVRGNGTNYQFAAGNQLDLLISQIPQTLSWPCSARLQGTLSLASGSFGFLVDSDDVSIDLGGHALRGTPSAIDPIAILGAYRGIAICNGAISGWFRGINAASSSGIRIEGITLSGLESNLGPSNGEAIRVGLGALVRGCVINACDCSGIEAGPGSVIESCAVNGAHYSGIVAGPRGTIRGCLCTGTYGAAGGSAISCGAGSLIADCSATGNHFIGINADDGSTVQNCVASDNDTGMQVQAGCLVVGNTVSGNQGAGINLGASGARVEGNCCIGNGTGIAVSLAGNFLARNTCSGNTVSNWLVAPGNVCLVASSAKTVDFVSGDAGGVPPGSTDPNANFTY